MFVQNFNRFPTLIEALPETTRDAQNNPPLEHKHSIKLFYSIGLGKYSIHF